MTRDWARRRWGRVRGMVLVAASNAVLGAAVALTAAVLGLVVEDLLPSSGPRHLSAARVAALVITLVLLFGSTLLRGRVHRHTGTLFYVRVLDESMDDWHIEPVEVAARRRMSLRSVTRWVDLPAHTTAGVIDLTDTCRQIAEALEAVVNADRDDTAYTIAPNMPWPAALAIGAELPLVDGLTLLELAGRPAGSVVQDTARAPEVILPVPTSPNAPGLGTAIRHEHAEIPGTPADGRVGLLLAFTGAALAPTMTPAAAFAGTPVSTWRRLSPACAGPDLAGLSTLRLTSEQLADLAAALPAAVIAIKQQAGASELVVAAAMPKTLAMALGWGLAQSRCRFFTGTHLLHFVSDGVPLQPMRVHPAQPARRLTESPG